MGSYLAKQKLPDKDAIAEATTTLAVAALAVVPMGEIIRDTVKEIQDLRRGTLSPKQTRSICWIIRG